MQLGIEQTAVVVGGASGMGEATVRALRARGVQVVVLDRDTERGRAVAQQTGAGFHPVDVMQEDSVVEAFAAARRAQGQERILVHTPGGGGLGATAWRDAHTGEIRRHDFERFGRVVALNLNATFLCASVSAAGMMTLPVDEDGERGVVVMTSSTASQDGPANTAGYVAAKSGLNGLTLAMARDLAPEAIRVNTILPGSFETPLIEAVPEAYKDEMRRWILHPKRFGRAVEYAALVLQLIENSYFNAALLRLDGGARI